MKETNRKQERPARDNVLVRQQPWKFGQLNLGLSKELEKLMPEQHIDVLGLCEGVSDLGRNYNIVCLSDSERKRRNRAALIFSALIFSSFNTKYASHICPRTCLSQNPSRLASNVSFWAYFLNFCTLSLAFSSLQPNCHICCLEPDCVHFSFFENQTLFGSWTLKEYTFFFFRFWIQ